ncbi:MAG: succinylglutamate desuccinylase/aspartoacylase family protein [Erythrobacter sp.]|nr:succinylglutamate desuccinylase/aspartoacylase family protein [Erythrobacter sp.]
MTSVETQPIKIGNTALRRGTREYVTVPVIRDLDSSTISLHIHAVTGARPGPAMAVVTVLHGGEWQAADIALELLNRVDPAELAGTLLVLPIANPLALASGTRNIRDESDSPDLNRSFGGEQTWLADQLANAISEHVLSKVDAVIDYHSGLWGATMGSVTCGRDFSDPEVSRRAYEMARAFGRGHVRRGDLATKFPGPKSMVGYAGQVLGVPGIISEVGGTGFSPEVEGKWLRLNVEGTLNVMGHLGMLERAVGPSGGVLVFDKVIRVNPTVGGMLEPIFPVEGLMKDEVQPGQLLGRVWSPYTFEVVEELRSPVRGLVDMVPRPYPVRPGDWAYLLIDLDAPGTRELAAGAAP